MERGKAENLALICMRGCEEFCDKIEYYIRRWHDTDPVSYTHLGYADYGPEEVPKLDNAVIKSSGNYISVSYTHLDVYKRQSKY